MLDNQQLQILTSIRESRACIKKMINALSTPGAAIDREHAAVILKVLDRVADMADTLRGSVSVR